ncbi:hypothetical protein [Halomonas elongata]|uniref:Uncharacterized protein n=1 Tax=Halomonas elongata (strain ATCC 33173 / DSM 2581 / NBRC 15536 / NCIMB 2198 / 1H9) TaxID=768066 RepID=A0ABZ0T4Y5_HALED|nr:hypothetical protein [Halomonas elongata]WBF16926.1 hypothetical protein LM502_12595 [Halomonas elongata]WPU45757.1 hypothetical protein SR933_10820 [Halomonas elongata DSM 2581]
MAQVRNQSEGQVMHGLFPEKVPDAVLYVLSDHEKQSMPQLGDEETGRRFALLILKLLAGRSSNASYRRGLLWLITTQSGPAGKGSMLVYWYYIATPAEKHRKNNGLMWRHKNVERARSFKSINERAI